MPLPISREIHALAALHRHSRLMPWSDRFEDPIPLPNGRQLVTLRDAATYIQKLPKAEQQAREWQTAAHCLIGEPATS